MNLALADEELRILFKTDTEEHLQKLDAGLLHLEKNPGDQQWLDETFRRAHSIKGAASMFGLEEIESLTHHFEEKLSLAKQGNLILTSHWIDRLYRALDGLKLLVRQAVSGESANVDVMRLISGLSEEGSCSNTSLESGDAESQKPDNIERGAGSDQSVVITTTDIISTPKQAAAFSNERNTDPREKSEESSTIETQVRPTSRVEPGNETIRVKARQLDTLVTLVGELSVTKLQASQKLADLDNLMALCDELQRDNNDLRRALIEASKQNEANAATTGTSQTQKNRLTKVLERHGERSEQLIESVAQLLKKAHEEHARLEFVADQLDQNVRAMRLVPLSMLFQLFPRLIRDVSRDLGKEVDLVVEGEETAADKRIIEELKDPLTHLVRNALDHGVESPEERERSGKTRRAVIRLAASQEGNTIIIEAADDGRGLNVDAIKQAALRRNICSPDELAAMSKDQAEALIFRPGFSTSKMITDISGRGVGLDVVRANVENLKGAIQIDSRPGRGCIFRLSLPVSLATTRCLIAIMNQYHYAIPVEFVEQTRFVSRQEVFSLEGRETIDYGGQPLRIVSLRRLIGARDERSRSRGNIERVSGTRAEDRIHLVVIRSGREQLGIVVDSVSSEQEIVLKPLGSLFRKVRHFSGATILGDGEVCLVLSPHDLFKTYRGRTTGMAEVTVQATQAKKTSVLLADDTLTTRTLQKRILENAGYEVVTAVDGANAWTILNGKPFDAVVTDVEMPHMDGLTLTAKIRSDVRFRDLPVILVTSLASETDRRRGVEAGANAYITKRSFDQKSLLDALARLV